MNENKTLLNWMIALSVFVILSGDQYDAVIKLIDFVSLLFALVVLVSAVRGKEKNRGGKEKSDQKQGSKQGQ